MSSSSSSMTPIVVGAAAVGAVGAGLLVYLGMRGAVANLEARLAASELETSRFLDSMQQLERRAQGLIDDGGGGSGPDRLEGISQFNIDPDAFDSAIRHLDEDARLRRGSIAAQSPRSRSANKAARAEEARITSRRRGEPAPVDAPPQVPPGGLVLFVNAACPFAQRAWITALEKTGGAPAGMFRAIHIELDPAEQPAWYAHNVAADGTVPALMWGDPDSGETVVLADSIPVCEWLDDNLQREQKTARGGTGATTNMSSSLIPENRALAKEIGDLITDFGQRFIKPGFELLSNTDLSRDPELGEAFSAACDWWEARLAAHGVGESAGQGSTAAAVVDSPSALTPFQPPVPAWRGLAALQRAPFYLGRIFSIVECLTFPFVDRFHAVLGFYRGFQLAERTRWPRMCTWLDACGSRPSIQFTRRTHAYYINVWAVHARNERRVWKR